jgi:2-hydroxychromene-2-carboxylate isomerase
MAFEFWFEFASTYSYLTALRVEELAEARGVRVVYRPFLLGPIFKGHGLNDSPFNVYPVKGSYMWRDVERCAHELGASFRRPSAFPRNGLLAARAALVADDLGASARYVPAVYRASFERDLDISQSSVVSEILTSLELPAADVLGRAQSEPVRQRLREQTARAEGLGIFGAPSFTVGSELFWGNDRLEQALDWAARLP